MKMVNIIFAIVFLAALFWLINEAFSHEFYSGIRNPVTGEGCCGGEHCKPVDVSRVEETGTEFIVDRKWHFPKDQAMPAPDGQYHACIWGGKPKCFFFPSNV